jgi:hypothetical protein
MARTHLMTVGLYVVAALLLANLAAVLSRNDGPAWLPPAYGQRQAPIAGGAGMFVMPGQLSGSTWGCYLMDVDRGTLCVYQFDAGRKQLHLVAARSFVNDTKLANFNTIPSPQEILDLVNKQEQPVRGGAVPAPAPDARPTKDN